MIIIEPLGGLCNRMRAIDSAMALAVKLQQSLTVHWKIDHSLGCRFDELFVRPAGVSKVVHYRNTRRSRLRARFHRLVNERITCDLQPAAICELMRQRFDFGLLRSHQGIHVSTYHAFLESSLRLDSFVPVPALRDIIASHTAGLANAVGVHIRRTDNLTAIARSPTQLFLEAMRAELAADAGVVFFLATDDPDEERKVLAAFPGRIRIHRKTSLRRNDPAAIRDAVVDLYCLAQCRKIIGSYWSSFSEVAQRLGGAELQLAFAPE